MDIVLTARVGFILILSQGGQVVRGDLHEGEGLMSYSDAVAACNDSGHQLVLPRDEYSNTEMMALIGKDQQTYYWLDLQISSTECYKKTSQSTSANVSGSDRLSMIKHGKYPTVHDTDEVLYNQGCYNISSLTFHHEVNSSSITDCYGNCKHDTEKFAAFQKRNNNEGHCICPSSILAYTADSNRQCVGRCSTGLSACGLGKAWYRVLSIDGTYDVPPWLSGPTLPPPTQESLQCASYKWNIEGSKYVQDLLRMYCLELLPSLCVTANGIVINNTESTWFQAHISCNGRLYVPNSNLSGQPNWSQNTPYWSGVTSWVYSRRNMATSPIVYTNWGGGQPNLTWGSCVIMRHDGEWESSSCDDQHGYICDSGYHPNLTSTAYTLAESTTQIAAGAANSTTSSSSSGTTRVTTDPTPVASTDHIHVSSESTVSNDTPVITTTSVHRETDSFTYITSPSERQSTGQFDVSGVKVGVPIALIAIIAGIVLSIVIYRRRQPTKTPATLLDNPTYNKANDDIISGKRPATLHNYELIKISQGETSTDHEVNLDQRDVTDALHIVCATPNIGLTTEGVLIVDNDLYGEVSKEQNDEPAADKEIPPDTDEGVFIVENHLYGEQLINSKPEQANIGRDDNSGNSCALTSEGGVRPPQQNAAVYEDAELVQTKKLHAI